MSAQNEHVGGPWMVTLPLGMYFIRVGETGETGMGGTISFSKTTELDAESAVTGAADTVGAGEANERAEGAVCTVLLEAVAVDRPE